MRLTQANFDKLVNGMNHRLTSLELDVKWIRKIGYYMSGLLTLAVIRGFM